MTLDKGRIIPAVLERIAQGELVADACPAEGVTPETFRTWCAADAEFSLLYARARESQAHALAEDTILIADGRDKDSEKRLAAMVRSVEEADDDDKDRLLNALASVAVQRDRLRTDTRKWYTSKVAPKLYGDKLDITSKGESVSGIVILPAPTED